MLVATLRNPPVSSASVIVREPWKTHLAIQPHHANPSTRNDHEPRNLGSHRALETLSGSTYRAAQLQLLGVIRLRESLCKPLDKLTVLRANGAGFERVALEIVKERDLLHLVPIERRQARLLDEELSRRHILNAHFHLLSVLCGAG